MVQIKIDRKTGRKISVTGSESSSDQAPEKLAEIIAKWAIRTGAVKIEGGFFK